MLENAIDIKDGILGLTSHHGIHGNNNQHVKLENFIVKGFKHMVFNLIQLMLKLVQQAITYNLMVCHIILVVFCLPFLALFCFWYFVLFWNLF